MFLSNYDTNLPEILHKYCLDLFEELILGLAPKYPEFPEKFRNLNFYGTFRIVWNFGNVKCPEDSGHIGMEPSIRPW